MREYTVKEYDIEDYDSVSMTLKEIADHLAYIDRGWLPDWNYTGTEDDYNNYLLHFAMHKAEKIIRELAKSEE